MPNGNASFAGGSGPSWNDAMMLGEARRFQAEHPNYIPGPGEPDFFGRRPPPTREQLAGQRRQKRRGRRIRAAVFAVVSLAFFIGTLDDWVGGHQSYTPSLIIAVTFGVLMLHQLLGAVFGAKP